MQGLQEWLLFALIVWVTYLPTQVEEVDTATKLEREQKLVETESKAEDLLTNYKVVSKTDGIYRIPIERAMELTVKSLQ